jgi:hypothetical protein
VESVGAQLAVASSSPGLLDVVDLQTCLDYFELLQRGGVIDKYNYLKNGVGVGIVTFNTVFIAIKATQEDKTLLLESFGKVS